MANFTTQITDPSVLNELPDVSILNTLHRDSLTQDDLLSLLNSVSFRKKLQTLFEFSFSSEAREIIEASLREAHDTYETEQGNTVTYSGGIMFVNGRAVSTDFGSFASGIFSDETFSTLFISNGVMDIVFGANDETFTNATLAIPKFWDMLIANDAVYAYVLNTYMDILEPYVKTKEVPYVKYVSNIIGLDVSRYNNITHLAEDGSAMEAIWVDESAKAIEGDSSFGVAARLMYIFGSVDIDTIQNDDDAISKLVSDPALESFVVDIDVLRQLDTDSKMAKFVIDHDGRFGTVASDVLQATTALNISNIFFDNGYSDVLRAFVRNNELVEYLLGSTLYANFADKFYDAFIETVDNIQKFAVTVNGDELNIFYTNTMFQTKRLATSLASFNETKAGSLSVVETAKSSFKIPMVFPDLSIMAINLDRGIEFTNSGNELIYNEFVGKSMNDVTSSGTHLFGTDNNGAVVSSKFVTTNINLSSETVENVWVYDEAAFIKTASTIFSIGNIGGVANDTRNKIIIEKDNIDKLAHINGEVLALISGSIKTIVGSTMEDYAPAVNIENGAVSDIFVVAGSLVVLDNAGNLFELATDATIDTISTSVTSVENAQDGLYITTSGNKRIVFKYNSTWNTYNHLVGGVEG